MVTVEELLGTKEAKTGRFVRAVLAEAVGTGMLVIVGCGSVSTLNKGLNPGAETMAVAFSFGFALAMIIWMFGHISGAHVNPCVSIGFLVTGHVSLIKVRYCSYTFDNNGYLYLHMHLLYLKHVFPK